MRLHILPFEEYNTKIKIMFEDEASFGRISDISRCWAPEGVRPLVPYHVVREHMQVYGAVDPIEGDSCFIAAPKCNTAWMNEFLKTLSKRFIDDYILLLMDNASWHKSKTLEIPENIRIIYLPPCTPEMNPIEQVWPHVRLDFKNKVFNSLNDLVDKLCDSLNAISNSIVKSITGRKWILDMF
jgi:putative transposase